MTTNLKIGSPRANVGFIDDGAYKSDLHGPFPPEFLNRIDEIVVFNNLEKQELEKISRIKLEEFKNRLSIRNIEINYADNLPLFIVEKSHTRGYGARPLIRYINRFIETPITDLIIEGESNIFQVYIPDTGNAPVIKSINKSTV